MSQPKLSLAMEHYDRSYPLLEGSVKPEGIDIEQIQPGKNMDDLLVQGEI